MDKTNILVVEDNRIVAEDIKRSLQKMGFLVTATISSGENALKQIETFLPDLVLMDIMLDGKMNGTEAAAIIRSRFDIPVVYLTAYSDEQILEKAKATEPFGYILKPFEDKELYTVIEIALYKHKTEKKLKQSEGLLKTTLNSIGDAVISTDIDGRITFMNPVAETVTGWKIEEVKGHPLETVFRIINESSEDPMENPAEKVLREGRIVGLANHTLLVTKDGARTPIDDSAAPIIDEKGKIIGVVLVFRDIHEKRKAEDELKDSQRRLATLMNNLPGMAYRCVNEPDWPMDFVSEGALALTGYASTELTETGALRYGDLIHPNDRRKVWEIAQKSIKTGEPFELEYRLQDKQGNERWVWERGIAVDRGIDGKTIIEGFITDITNRKQMEERLSQAQKMESIGTLAGGVAHEFNNLLSIILGNAELARDNIPTWNLAHEFLSEIKTASLRGKDVVKQLLSFSRKSPFEKHAVDLGVVIHESLGFLRASIPANIQFRENSRKNCHFAMADLTQIHQVMINLCNNGAQAMEENGGVLEINLMNVTVAEREFFSDQTLEPGEYVRLTITDTGRGIPDHAIAHVFDPFFTTKAVDKGSGMGLAVVYGIMKRHDGFIKIESRPGKGTTVSCYFRSTDPPPVKAAEIAEALPSGTETILFVDDEPSLAKLGHRLLERMGYTVEIQTDPREALYHFKAAPDKFDLVITDMTMPGMTGDQFIIELIKIRPGIKTIINTGFSSKIDEKTASEIGANGYLMKPISIEILAKTVRKVLDGEVKK